MRSFICLCIGMAIMTCAVFCPAAQEDLSQGLSLSISQNEGQKSICKGDPIFILINAVNHTAQDKKRAAEIAARKKAAEDGDQEEGGSGVDQGGTPDDDADLEDGNGKDGEKLNPWINRVKITLYEKVSPRKKVEAACGVIDPFSGLDTVSDSPCSVSMAFAPEVTAKLREGEYVVVAECSYEDVCAIAGIPVAKPAAGGQKIVGRKGLTIELPVTILPEAKDQAAIYSSRISVAKYWIRKQDSGKAVTVLEDAKKFISSDQMKEAWLNLISQEYEKREEYDKALVCLKELKELIKKRPANTKSNFSELVDMNIESLEQKIKQPKKKDQAGKRN